MNMIKRVGGLGAVHSCPQTLHLFGETGHAQTNFSEKHKWYEAFIAHNLLSKPELAMNASSASITLCMCS